jgi:hypothetical protein
MTYLKYLDSLVRERLRAWPQHPPGMGARPNGTDAWLRGRPTAEPRAAAQPFLKFPGSTRLRTLPDGLWLNFGGTPVEPFVDIFAIEACATLPNLLDKRSRFAASTQSMLAYCPVPWLLAPAYSNDDVPRWRLTGVLRHAPTQPLVLPVRDVRVMYGLRPALYDGFVRTQVPHPHEYFVPMTALTEPDGANEPRLRALLSRACAAASFIEVPLAAPSHAASPADGATSWGFRDCPALG